MPEGARSPDYIWQHDNLARRVRNLETGVHPVSADVGYWDTYGPATIEDISSRLSPAGVSGNQVGWYRRTGHVYLFGIVSGSLSTADTVDGDLYGVLPAVACPEETQNQMIAATVAPFYCRVRIEEGGDLRLIPPTTGLTTMEFALNNISYPAKR